MDNISDKKLRSNFCTILFKTIYGIFQSFNLNWSILLLKQDLVSHQNVIYLSLVVFKSFLKGAVKDLTPITGTKVKSHVQTASHCY